MTQKEFQKLLEKQRQGSLNKAEENLLEEFVNRLQQNQKHRRIDPGDDHKKRIRKKIDQAIDAHTPQRRLVNSKVLAYVSGLAAVLCISFFAFRYFSVEYISVATGKGEQRSLVMSDGSKIWLNANSSLTYPENFNENRNLQLTGEAFFEVFRDEQHPFTIKTGAVRTTVLGTSFNINSYDPASPVVSVRSGKVKVEHTNTGEKVYLVKNQELVFENANSPVTTTGNLQDTMLWMQKTIVLNNTSLLKTATVLENWYDVTIDFADPSIKELRITGKFHDEPLETVLQSIALINHLKIDTLSQNHFMIRKNAP
ncbi:FecR family protein [Leeuwenhoekiella sp. H156]|uniref:FecR family protein n=1 Tax=Leeuwenhoekiella sp. H156 TaxID=3450128 RepID=UPI003FA41F59